MVYHRRRCRPKENLAKAAAALVAAAVLCGCAGDAAVPRWNKPGYFARSRGWSEIRLNTEPFLLEAVVSPAQPGGRLTIYLEGDGLAYLGAARPSPDPTPLDPVALRLAVAHPEGNVAYLARPCQYLPAEAAQPACSVRAWTLDRYGPEVVASLSQAIDQLKTRFAARELVLVGYSGGGALAVLLAGRRSDVRGLVTIAAPLDTAYWTTSRHLAPLTGTNPADLAAGLAAVPQVHLVGGRDEVVGTDVAQAYLRRQGSGGAARVVTLAEADHGCCWADQWPALLRRSEIASLFDR